MAQARHEKSGGFLCEGDPTSKPLSFTLRVMTQPSPQVASWSSPRNRGDLLEFPIGLLKYRDAGAHLHLLHLSCQGTKRLKPKEVIGIAGALGCTP